MKLLLFFIPLFRMMYSLSIYIDSSYLNNDADGTLNKPFSDSNMISQIIQNGLSNTFIIGNYFLITSQIAINNSVSPIIFQYYFKKKIDFNFQSRSNNGSLAIINFAVSGSFSVSNSSLKFISVIIGNFSQNSAFSSLFFLESNSFLNLTV